MHYLVSSMLILLMIAVTSATPNNQLDACAVLRKECERCDDNLYSGDQDGIMRVLQKRCSNELQGLKVTRCDAMEFNCRGIASCAPYSCKDVSKIVRRRLSV